MKAPRSPTRSTTVRPRSVTSTQYFEMFGNRGIYHDGWTAVTKHRTPWTVGQIQTQPFTDDVGELYDTRSDWSQARDLADTYPERLASLQRLFLDEARKYQVLPLDDRVGERMNADLAGRKRLATARGATFGPHTGRLREDTAPNVKNTSFRVSAVLDAGTEFTDGVLVAQGGFYAGWSLYLKEGLRRTCTTWPGSRDPHPRGVPASRRAALVEYVFAYDGGGVGKGGTGTLAGRRCGRRQRPDRADHPVLLLHGRDVQRRRRPRISGDGRLRAQRWQRLHRGDRVRDHHDR